MQRKQTAAFISADDHEVQIRRRGVNDNGAGAKALGRIGIIEPQWFRLVPASSPHVQRLETEGGMTERAEWLLVGFHNANVKKDDELEIQGNRYQVVAIHPDRSYETLASLKELGNVSSGD